MLLFITGEDLRDYIGGKFQYISCYSLSYLWQNRAALDHVSIHLMLLFILYGYGRMEATTEFQYISCYSLSRKGMGYGTSGMRVSIHLMLLFIWLCLYKVSCGLMFQYISCYSLSVMAGTQGTFRTSFNTSHVTLYPDQREFCISVCMFQYISCYSLSWNGEYKWDGTIRFNTSHVTLYLHPASQSSAHVRVSIHLMLLFIISFSTEFTILKTRFNTSHVTLYRLHE